MYLKDYLKEYFSKNPKIGLHRILRHFFFWKRAYSKQLSALDLGIPWLNFPAIDFLDKYLKKRHKVLEYGAGGSTIYFLKKCKQLVTIEHNKEWINKLKIELKRNKIAKQWKYCFTPPRRLLVKKKKQKYNAYLNAVKQFRNGTFDCILIDGEVRDGCFLSANKKLKIDGLLILDDAERGYFQKKEIKGLLKNYKCVFNAYGPRAGLRYFNLCKIYQKIR